MAKYAGHSRRILLLYSADGENSDFLGLNK